MKEEGLGRSLTVIAEGGADAFYSMLVEEIRKNKPEFCLLTKILEQTPLVERTYLHRISRLLVFEHHLTHKP